MKRSQAYGQIFARAGGKPFAQNILDSCPNFYKTVERKRGPYDTTTQAVLAYESGSIQFFWVNTCEVFFEHRLRHHKQTFGQIATTVVLDNHYLLYLQEHFSLGTVLPKSFTGAFSSNSRLDARKVKTESVRALRRYFGIKFLSLEIR